MDKIKTSSDVIPANIKTVYNLRRLLMRLHSSTEARNNQIASKLHDGLCQLLTAIKIDVSLLRKKILANDVVEKDYFEREFNSMVMLIDKTIASVKKIESELIPRKHNSDGIVEAIKSMALAFENKNATKCVVEEIGVKLKHSFNFDSVIYRIIDEVFTNIEKHARATAVKIIIGTKDNNFIIKIKDNGIGINLEKSVNEHSLGLIDIREQVYYLKGTINIDGIHGEGTKVSVTIPVY